MGEQVIKRKLSNIINNKFDINDFNLSNNELIIDLTWYDDRILENHNFELKETTLPQLIKIGQYNQWDCGYNKYKLN